MKFTDTFLKNALSALGLRAGQRFSESIGELDRG
jgi:hypothetical protein